MYTRANEAAFVVQRCLHACEKKGFISSFPCIGPKAWPPSFRPTILRWLRQTATRTPEVGT